MACGHHSSGPAIWASKNKTECSHLYFILHCQQILCLPGLGMPHHCPGPVLITTYRLLNTPASCPNWHDAALWEVRKASWDPGVTKAERETAPHTTTFLPGPSHLDWLLFVPRMPQLMANSRATWSEPSFQVCPSLLFSYNCLKILYINFSLFKLLCSFCLLTGPD